MNRREPPRSAAWVLQHLTSGECDEALLGDLLEEFFAGRSEGWYWRQVIAVCVVSWFRTLQALVPLLFFALAWSMLSPAWKALCDRIQDSQTVVNIWPIFGGFWAFPAFCLWLALHSTFLCAGALLYAAVHKSFGNGLRQDSVRRALILAPWIFSLVHGATYLLLNLYWYSLPGLAGQSLASTPLRQVADLRLLADAIRLPYFIALLSALWGVVQTSPHTVEQIPVELNSANSQVESGTISLNSLLDSITAKRFFALTVAAGLINAMIAAFLLCRLPEATTPSVASVLIRSIVQVLTGIFAGFAGTWIYWHGPWSPFRERPPMPFPRLALVCASAWVWVPSMVIFSGQISPAMAFVASIGAYMLASGLRNIVPVSSSPAVKQTPLTSLDFGLFARSIYRSPSEAHGYLIAVGLYGGCGALSIRANWTATVLLALTACVFAWEQSLPPTESTERSFTYKNAATRLAVVLIPAVLVTAWALLDGVAHRNRAGRETAEATAISKAPANDGTKRKPATGSGIGYESVILFPHPERKQIVSPFPKAESFLAPGTTRPLVIRFEGTYRYVQPPEKVPGVDAHRAQGSPLNVDIESNNTIPLVMDAHQNLAAPIPTKRCREIQVDIENHENHTGPISLALLLTDGASPQSRTLYLGQQPIVSTEADHFSFKPAAVFETLHFGIPVDAKVRKFDEITVLFLPDIEHSFVAPKIAIEQFRLIPR